MMTALLGALLLLAPNSMALEVGGRVVVAPSVTGSPSDPLASSAAYDGTLDRFLVAWLGAASTANSTVNVWARFVTSDGQPLGAPFLAATVENGADARDATSIIARYDPLRREYLLVFCGQRNASVPGDVELYAQWLDDSGVTIGRSVAVSRVSAGAISAPTVIADSDRDRFILAYQEHRPSSGLRVVVQSLRRGEIGPVRDPFAPLMATNPAVAITNDGVLVAARVGEHGDLIALRWLGPELDQTLRSGGIVLNRAPAAGPRLLTDASRSRAVLGWAEATGGATLATFSEPAVQPPARTLFQGEQLDDLAILPLAREDRWLAVARRTGDATLTSAELNADLTPLATREVTPDDAPVTSGIVPRTPLQLSLDSTRQWALATYAGGVSGARTLLGRVIASSPPSPQSAVAPALPATARCVTGAVLYVPTTGSACGPAPVPAFTVAPITTRSRRQLLGVAVRPTAKDQQVRVECISRCGRLRPVLSSRGKRGATDVMFGRWRVARGSVIEVRIERPEATTRFRRFTLTTRFPFLAHSTSACRLPTGIEAPC